LQGHRNTGVFPKSLPGVVHGGGFLIDLIWIVILILVPLDVGHVPDEIYDGVFRLEDCKILGVS
jgi:hypothetical protein